MSTFRKYCLLVMALVCFNLVAEQEGTRFFRVVGPDATCIESFGPDGVILWSNSTADVTCLVQIATSLANDGDWRDYALCKADGFGASLQVIQNSLPHGMAFVPGGQFAMGDSLGEGDACELPCHTVTLNPSLMSQSEISLEEWECVREWAMTNGYTFASGSAIVSNHPIVNVNWFDCVKWCNARSEMEGLVPCCYTDSLFSSSSVYRDGESVASYFVDSSASGYRLPTEAEWEHAARGGLHNMRFAWGNAITHTQANYYSSSTLAYDISETLGAHPENGSAASETGHFHANGYEVCGVSGNVREWCWDWFDHHDEPCPNCDTGNVPCSCGDGQGADPCSVCSDGTVECMMCDGTGYGPGPCTDPLCTEGHHPCIDCEGRGWQPCDVCEGQGQLPCDGGSMYTEPCVGGWRPCEWCSGTGVERYEPCSCGELCHSCMGYGCGECGGDGYISSGGEPMQCFECGGLGCELCFGSGFQTCGICGGMGCPWCGGSGFKTEECWECMGTGVMTVWCEYCNGEGGGYVTGVRELDTLIALTVLLQVVWIVIHVQVQELEKLVRTVKGLTLNHVRSVLPVVESNACYVVVMLWFVVFVEAQWL